MRIIAVANQKGGCGKTTVSINLGATLAREGKRTLLVDLDPQGHCSLGMAVPEEQIDLSVFDCFMGQIEGKPVELSRIAWQITPCLDLAPSRADLCRFEPTAAGKPKADLLLKQMLEATPDAYDFVILDCPPHLGLLTINAMRAATDVVIPVDTGFFSLHGLTRQLQTVDLLFEGQKQPLVRVLPNQYDVRTKMAREILNELKTRFGNRVFKTTINFNTKLKEGASFGQPITEFAPSSMGARDFRTLAREILAEQQMGDTPEDLLRSADQIAEKANKLLASSKTLIGEKPKIDGNGKNARKSEVPTVGTATTSHAEIQKKIDRQYGIKQTEEGVIFRSNHNAAREVQIAGDFNHWIPYNTVMQRVTDDGDFTTTVQLPPGKYRYRLVIDGRWVHDQSNPVVEQNEFGEMNSVVEVQ